ncbi:MAG: hypothetical protein AAFX50_20225, partial [Acidobacteriota bacterium]
MKRVRDLLTVLGFEVDVFDEPSAARPDEEAERRIHRAECVVILLGPAQPGADASQLAEWPLAESLIAKSSAAPLLIILHEDSPPPQMLTHEAWPRFDFWDPKSYADSVHLVAKRLIELNRSIGIRETSQLYEFRVAEIINRVKSEQEVEVTVLNEAVAREPCGVFFHRIDLRGMSLEEAQSRWRIQQLTGDRKELAIIPKSVDDGILTYHVTMSPSLRTGESVLYRRVFQLPNNFPLDQKSVEKASQSLDIANFDRRMFGSSFEIQHHLHYFRLAIKLPIDVSLDRTDVVVVDLRTRQALAGLGDKHRGAIKENVDMEHGERVIELKVSKPELG